MGWDTGSVACLSGMGNLRAWVPSGYVPPVADPGFDED
jgi:hypothetical protein